MTSAAWSDTLGASVGLAYVWRPDREAGDPRAPDRGRYEVNVGGRRCAASVGLRAFYDPANERVRS